MRTREFLSALVIIPLIISCYYPPPGKPEPRRRQAVGRAPVAPPRPLDPAKSALEGIQRQYRAELEEFVIPGPGREPDLGAAAMKCKGFPRTLQAIRAFDMKYGTKNPEHAHLTVLKGMIYLQSGKFRSASAIEPEVLKAAPILSASADSQGNELLARSFNDLVTGWREIHKHTENLKARDAGKSFPFANADFDKLHQAADQVGEKLRRYSENPEITRDRESRLTGLYVAVVAATFYTWLQENNDRSCRNKNSEDCTPKKRMNKENAVFYKKGRDLIGLYLTETEKNSAVRGQIMKAGMSTSRHCYLSWYGWLSRKVREATIHSHKKRMANRN